jgi:hypothetical protein
VGQLKNMQTMPIATMSAIKTAFKSGINVEINSSVTRKLTARTDKIYLSIIFAPLRINN